MFEFANQGATASSGEAAAVGAGPKVGTPPTPSAPAKTGDLTGDSQQAGAAMSFWADADHDKAQPPPPPPKLVEKQREAFSASLQNGDVDGARGALRKLPPDQREAAIAQLPEEQRIQAMGQLERIADEERESRAADERKHAVAAIGSDQPGAYAGAVDALKDASPEERAKLLAALPKDQQGLAKEATVEADKKAEAEEEAGRMRPDQEQLDKAKAAIEAMITTKKGDANAGEVDKNEAKALGSLSPEQYDEVMKGLSPEARAYREKEQEDAAKGALESAKAGDKTQLSSVIEREPPAVRAKILKDLAEKAKNGEASEAEVLAVRGAMETAAAKDADKEKSQAKVDEALKGINAVAAKARDGAWDGHGLLKAMKDVPPERYKDVVDALPEGARWCLKTVEETYAKTTAEALTPVLEAREGMNGPAAEGMDKGLDKGFEKQMEDLPPAMRRSIAERMPENLRDAALAAAERANQTDKEISEGSASFENLAKAGAPGDKDTDAQKQRDEAMADALEKIPYAKRDEVLAKMDDKTRAVAEEAKAKKTKELEGKSADLFKAVNAGMLEAGTDIATIRKTLATLSANEAAELKAIYAKQNEGHDLEKDLLGEVGGDSPDVALISAALGDDKDRSKQKAIALQLAAKGSGVTDGTDEELLFKTLESIKDPKEREKVFEEFKKRQREAGEEITDVKDMIKDELLTGEAKRDDYDYNRAMALAEGNFKRAKAIQVDQSLDPGILGDVSIRDVSFAANAIPIVGQAICAGVNIADAAGIIDADKKLAEPNTEAVAQIMADCKSQEERDGIAKEHERATGVSLEATVMARCEKDYDRNLVKAATANDKVGINAARWMKNADKQNSDEQGMMSQLEGEDHAKVIERINKEYGEGTFDRVSKKVMNEEELAANKELAETGKVKPETGLVAAMPDWSASWDLKDIKKNLVGKDGKLLKKDEMDRVKAAVCEKRGITPAEFDKEIEQHLGGKDAFKLRQMFKGEPKDFREKMDRMREEHAFNREGASNAAGNVTTDALSDAGKVEDAQMAKLEESYKTLDRLQKSVEAGNASPEERAEYGKAKKEFDERSGYFDSNVTNYQASRDTVTNDLTTIGATIAGAAVTLATAGTCGPVVAAGLGALYAGAATMVGKEILLGDSYNTHDQVKDGVQTAISTGVAIGTAGMSKGLDAFATSVGASAGGLLKGAGGEVVKEVVTEFTKAGAGAVVGGVVNNTASAVLDENVLAGKGDPLEIAGKVMKNTGTGALGAAMTGAVSKSLGKIGLETADATSGKFTAASHFLNKGTSQVVGDAVAFASDPANLQGNSVGKFLAKESMSAPGTIIGAAGEYGKARAEQDKHEQAWHAAEREEGAWKGPVDHAKAAEMVAEDRKQEAAAKVESRRVAKAAEELGYSWTEVSEDPAKLQAAKDWLKQNDARMRELPPEIETREPTKKEEREVERTREAEELRENQPPDIKTREVGEHEEVEVRRADAEDQKRDLEKHPPEIEARPATEAEGTEVETAEHEEAKRAERKAFEDELDKHLGEPLESARHEDDIARDEAPKVSARELGGAELHDVHLEIEGAENTAHMKERARAAAQALPDGERAAYDKAMAEAKTPLAAEMIERSLAAGNRAGDVAELASRIGEMSDEQIQAVLTGKGSVVQASAHSCVPASMQIAIAQADPVFALKLADNPELMLQMQRAALDSVEAKFPQRHDVTALPPEVSAAIARNPELGEILLDPSKYHDEGKQSGMSADQVRDTPLKARLEGTVGDAGTFQPMPHDQLQEQLAKTGSVPIGKSEHARVITGAFTDEKGNLCYVVRDPHTAASTVVKAADLEIEAGPGPGLTGVKPDAPDGRERMAEPKDLQAKDDAIRRHDDRVVAEEAATRRADQEADAGERMARPEDLELKKQAIEQNEERMKPPQPEPAEPAEPKPHGEPPSPALHDPAETEKQMDRADKTLKKTGTEMNNAGGLQLPDGVKTARNVWHALKTVRDLVLYGAKGANPSTLGDLVMDGLKMAAKGTIGVLAPEVVPVAGPIMDHGLEQLKEHMPYDPKEAVGEITKRGLTGEYGRAWEVAKTLGRTFVGGPKPQPAPAAQPEPKQEPPPSAGGPRIETTPDSSFLEEELAEIEAAAAEEEEEQRRKAAQGAA